MDFLQQLLSQLQGSRPQLQQSRNPQPPQRNPQAGGMSGSQLQGTGAYNGSIRVPGSQQPLLQVGNFPQVANNGHRYEDQPYPGIPLASQWQSRANNYQQDDINGINPQGFNYGINGIPNQNAVDPYPNNQNPQIGRGGGYLQKPVSPQEDFLRRLLGY